MIQFRAGGYFSNFLQELSLIESENPKTTTAKKPRQIGRVLLCAYGLAIMRTGTL
jgi:hypothetical protein